MARFCCLDTYSYALFFISSLVLAFHFHASEAQAHPQVVKGLSFSFFSKTCPNLETVVRDHLSKVLKKDNGQAPGLLRIFFHDCFVTVSNCNHLVQNIPYFQVICILYPYTIQLSIKTLDLLIIKIRPKITNGRVCNISLTKNEPKFNFCSR